MSYCRGVGHAILKLYYMCYWIKQRNECAGPRGPRVPLWKEGHANMTSGKKRKTLEGMDWNWGGLALSTQRSQEGKASYKC